MRKLWILETVADVRECIQPKEKHKITMEPRSSCTITIVEASIHFIDGDSIHECKVTAGDVIKNLLENSGYRVTVKSLEQRLPE